MCKKLFYPISLVLVLGMIGSSSADLVVHWPLEDGSGTVATDVSGNGNDGTFNGAPEWVDGYFGLGLHVRGDADSDSVVHTIPGEATVWETGTIAMWVKIDSLGQDNYSSCFTNHTPNSAGIQFDVDGGTPGNFRLNPGGQFFGPATTEWTHLALTFEAGTGTFYYNSVEATTAAVSDSQRTFNEFAIGINRNHTNWMAATIDEFRVYDHALTADEIQTIMESVAGGLPLARRPEPEDGAMIEQTWASLAWRPGDFAVSHDLYFGTGFDDVNGGAESAFVGNTFSTSQVVGFPGFPAPEGLQPGTTYYWRIDEVNEADPNSPWKGNVWSFAVPPKTAYNPSPADGAKFADPNVELTWTSGFDAKLHTAYFGDNFDDVNNAAGGLPLADPSYVPGTLELEKVYYWRVDQFDGAATHKGDVWSFTTTRPGGGLKAEYFNNTTLSGEPALIRLDPEIDFNWGNADVPGENSPDESIGVNNFGARWTGELEVDLTDTYVFGINANNGFRLWLDGEPIINYWDNPTTSSRQSAPIDLVGSSTYSIRMDYFEGDDVAIARLFWESGTREEQIVPSGALQPLSRAGDPNPYNGATGVTQIIIPSWRSSETAASHQVYFGTDAEAVKNATTASPEYQGSKALGEETLDPGKLAWQTTYHWRVDEVDNANPNSPVAGKVWSFTTADFLLVEDFESYNDLNPDEPGSNRVFTTWIDGFGTTTNGALVGNDVTPFMELSIVHGGFQSLPYFYDNNLKTSEATMTLAYPRDWTEEGVTKLSLWFRGGSANAAEQMYVALNGNAVVYHDDPDAAQTGRWTEWVIDLQAFADQGVDLTNVNTIAIGFGTKGSPAAGGSGTLFIDEIRLRR
ncbi:MAG: hypothetical protein CEE38_12985 [Planctomycetes bacterium B3_Pla]|nr:MAG: hypothetical protein CEE38_12985 [Planctomycetes bacterium B3_Pla]